MDTILIIEDDKILGEGIAMTLEGPDVNITRAESLAQGEAFLAQHKTDLILLDVNLPDGDGFEFCRTLRREKNIPVIFLTARDMEMDIVRGLEMGADDYITKPFSLMILRARVKSVLRRQQSGAAKGETSACFQIDDLTLDFDNMEFLKEKQEILLSRTEQKLLKILVLNRGRTLSKEQLLDKVWETDFVDDHALTVTIKRLRDKLGTGRIKSIYGIGYIWRKEEKDA